LRDRVHPISLSYKIPKFSKLISKLSDAPTPTETLSKEDEDQIETNLTSLFEFLNVNLEMLTVNLDENLSLCIVQGVWERFLKTSELMVVPSLGDDPKDRKPWDERRIKFFARYIEVAQEFFRPAEDEGLPLEQIESKSYLQLKLIIEHYHLPKHELINLYNDMARKVRHSSAHNLHIDSDWLLKLLKLKGHEQFVNQQLQNRCLKM
jgi:hypothetical protein